MAGPSFNFGKITQWKNSYTSCTAKEVPWNLFYVLLNVHQITHLYFVVYKIPHEARVGNRFKYCM
jgi:hypothetical protein